MLKQLVSKLINFLITSNSKQCPICHWGELEVDERNFEYEFCRICNYEQRRKFGDETKCVQ